MLCLMVDSSCMYLLQVVGGCDKTLPKGFPSTSQQPLCHVTSQADGSFVFATVPTGHYYLVSPQLAERL